MLCFNYDNAKSRLFSIYLFSAPQKEYVIYHIHLRYRYRFNAYKFESSRISVITKRFQWLYSVMSYSMIVDDRAQSETFTDHGGKFLRFIIIICLFRKSTNAKMMKRLAVWVFLCAFACICECGTREILWILL